MDIRGKVAYDKYADGGGYLHCSECNSSFYGSNTKHNSNCKNDNAKFTVFIKVFTVRELNKFKSDRVPFFASDEAINEFTEKFKELF
jgi:hypothetical protein